MTYHPEHSLGINVKDNPYNANGNGSIDDSAQLAHADSAASSAGTHVVLPVGTYRVNKNVTFFSPVYFHPGAILTIDNGKTVTFSQQIIAHPTQKLFTVDPTWHLPIPVPVTLTRRAGSYISVAWWGAVGDGVANDTVPCQAALDAAKGAVLGIPIPTGQHPVDTVIDVWFPAATYKVNETLFVWAYIKLTGNMHTCISSTSTTIPLLQIWGYYNHIEHLAFQGGLNSIRFYGSRPSYPGRTWGSPQTDGGRVLIEDVVLRNPSGPAIYLDTSEKDSISNAYISIDHFNFEGRCLFWGACEKVSVTHGDCYWTADAVLLDDQGNDMPCFGTSGNFHMRDVMTIPATNAVTSPAFIQGSGIIDVGDVRFGGESRYVALRVRDSNTYMRFGLPHTTTYSRAMISVDTSIMAGCANLNWLEVYDHFPASISVRNLFASSDGNPGSEFQPVTKTLGVWVDSGVALPDEGQSQLSGSTYSTKQCTINFEGFDATTVSRFRRSSDPRSIAGAVTSRLDAWFTHMDDGLDEPGPQNNLWFKNCWDWVQADTGGASFPNLVYDGTHDSSTGYEIKNYTASADCAYGFVNAGTWGVTVPAGEYVLSVYARGTAEFVVDLRLGGGVRSSIRKSQRINAGRAYQRVSVPFTNASGGDGVIGVPNVTIQASQIPKGATVNIGFAAIHRGRRPSKWTFPVDDPQVPKQYSTQETRQSTYYAVNAPPTGSHFNAGDICWNTSKSSGVNPSGWTWNGSRWLTLQGSLNAFDSLRQTQMVTLNIPVPQGSTAIVKVEAIGKVSSEGGGALVGDSFIYYNLFVVKNVGGAITVFRGGSSPMQAGDTSQSTNTITTSAGTDSVTVTGTQVAATGETDWMIRAAVTCN